MKSLRIHRSSIVPAVLLAAALVFAGAGCKKGGAAASSAPQRPGSKARVTFPVEVAPVKLQSLVYSVGAVGSVDAFEKVQVTARVAGVVKYARETPGGSVRSSPAMADRRCMTSNAVGGRIAGSIARRDVINSSSAPGIPSAR